MQQTKLAGINESVQTSNGATRLTTSFMPSRSQRIRCATHTVRGVAFSVAFFGCATTVAGTGTASLAKNQRAAAGLRLAEQVFIPETRFVAGVESALKARFGPFDDVNQWQLSALVGYSDWPRPWEDPVGYELLAVLSATRAYVDREDPVLRAALGGRANLVFRLSAQKPPWQSDDLLSWHWLLVPTAGCTIYPDALEAELEFGLALRVLMWSAVAP